MVVHGCFNGFQLAYNNLLRFTLWRITPRGRRTLKLGWFMGLEGVAKFIAAYAYNYSKATTVGPYVLVVGLALAYGACLWRVSNYGSSVARPDPDREEVKTHVKRLFGLEDAADNAFKLAFPRSGVFSSF